MMADETNLEDINGGQTSPSSKTRSHSRSRSLRSRISHSNSLRKVHSAQHFDDHTAYSPQPRSPTGSPWIAGDGDSTKSGSSSDHGTSPAAHKELRKSKSHELRSPELEVRSGIMDEKDIEDGPEPPREAQGDGERDPNLVTWDGPDDPENPKNWSIKRKWAATFLVSSFTFISPVSSSMVAPALSTIARELGIHSQFETSMVLSIFVLAYAVGPLFLGPLSEVYGRVVVLQLSNLWFLFWNLACGFAKNGSQMLLFRFLSGLGGSAPLALGGGVLSDCWSADNRGKAISIYTLAPLLGPAVGPIAGGFIAQNTTWRWVFWAVTILDAVIQVFGFFFLQETYAPTLLQRKAAALRKETGNENLRTEFDSPDRKLTSILATALYRPFRLLGTQPIIQVIALYMAYLYGLMYLMLSTFPSLWTQRYGEPIGTGGLNYISLGVGFFGGSQITAPLSDRIYRRLKRRNNNVGRPEFRVPLQFLGSLLIPIGLFWYGWAAQAKAHWIVPNIGASIFSAGCIVCFQSMQTYIVDSYTRYAASGVAAAVVLRSLAGFTFPLFAPYMFKALGFGWGNSILGFVAILVGVPAPFMFWFWGERLRAKSTFAAG